MLQVRSPRRSMPKRTVRWRSGTSGRFENACGRNAVMFLAVAPDNCVVGPVTGLRDVEPPATVGLVSMWIAPEVRRQGARPLLATSPVIEPSPCQVGPSRARRSTRPRCWLLPRSASTSPASFRSHEPTRSSTPQMSWRPWAVATPVVSSPTPATRTGTSSTQLAKTSRQSARSATRSNTACGRSL